MPNITKKADHKWQFKYEANSNSAKLFVVVGAIDRMTGKINNILFETTHHLPNQHLSGNVRFSHELDIRTKLHEAYKEAGIKINPLPDIEKYAGVYVEASGRWQSVAESDAVLLKHKSIHFALATGPNRLTGISEAKYDLGLNDGTRRNNLGRAGGGAQVNSFSLYPDTLIRMYSQFLVNETNNQFHDPEKRSYLVNNIESKTGVELVGVSTFRPQKRAAFLIAPAIWTIEDHDSLELEQIIVDPISSGHGGNTG